MPFHIVSYHPMELFPNLLKRKISHHIISSPCPGNILGGLVPLSFVHPFLTHLYLNYIFSTFTFSTPIISTYIFTDFTFSTYTFLMFFFSVFILFFLYIFLYILFVRISSVHWLVFTHMACLRFFFQLLLVCHQ